MFKRLVEKLYYKCYPDRVRDHEIATMPLPKPQVIPYDIVPIRAPKIGDSFFLKETGDYNKMKEFAHKELTRCIAKEIEKYITFNENCDMGFLEFRAELYIAKRRGD